MKRTSKVPEDDHKAPLLVVDIPCLRNALFTLCATKESSAHGRRIPEGNDPPSVDIETSSKNHESHILEQQTQDTELKLHLQRGRTATYRSNGAILLVLLASTTDGDQEKKDPRNTDFCPHLQVDTSNPGIERSAHPVVVEEVAAHPHRGSRVYSNDVGEPADEETIEHGDGHNRAKVFDDCRQAEESGVVEDGRGNESGVKGREGVTVVCESLVVERWHGEALLLVPGHDDCEDELDDD
jgi:hypothetical protein